MDREQLIADTFVELADTLVDDFDIIDFLHLLAVRSVEVLDATAAGIMLADHRRGLHMLASSTEEARLLELFEVQNDEGPCMDCFRAGTVIDVTGEAMAARWPKFTPRLQELGFQSAQAIPLRLRKEVVGALNLFRAEPAGLTPAQLRLGQALADVATIGLMQERVIAEHTVLGEQLQTALNSRVLIEQAKGVLAERAGIGMDEAFHLLRRFARSKGQRLLEVSTLVIDGQLDVAAASAADGAGRR